jgi:transcriptional regulator with PAS, ATPase and Fis domain
LYPESQIYDNFENIFKDFVVEKNIKSNTPDRNDRTLQDNQSFEERVSLFEMKLISNALERSYGNVNLSSKLLKIKPSTLRDKIKKLNIDPSEFKI